ncbi:MAG: ADP-ribosylglycohydrolase family protein [Desulfobacterales bacterium]|nr:ADP-ribosylglycohydrolase family protein [Desulfobacterales bacterium]
MGNTGSHISLNDRRSSAILGMFVGDALAMPVHGYADRETLVRDYGLVTDYLRPKNPHPGSRLYRSKYTPLNEKGEILHEQAQYWGEIGIHYHQFLSAGENTLNLKLCTLLINSLIHHRGYNPDDYLKSYIDFMRTPGNHRDTYIEEHHQQFFRSYAMGKRPRFCGSPQKNISGIIGMIPIVLFYAEHPDMAREAALTHLNLTHLGPTIEVAASFLLDVLISVLNGEPLQKLMRRMILGQENQLLNPNLMDWRYKPDETVIGDYIGSADTVEQAVPAIAYLAMKYHEDTERCLIANTNLGGDNAGRGAILGALMGAANGMASIPDRWIKGLLEPPPELFGS